MSSPSTHTGTLCSKARGYVSDTELLTTYPIFAVIWVQKSKEEGKVLQSCVADNLRVLGLQRSRDGGVRSGYGQGHHEAILVGFS